MARNKVKTPYKNRIRDHSIAGTIFYTAIATLLVCFTIILTFFVLWAILNAFKQGDNFEMDGNYFGLPIWNEDFGPFDNFAAILKDFHIKTPTNSYYSSIWGQITIDGRKVYFGEMLFNTLIYAGGGALFQSVLPAIVAFMLCKYRFKFSKFLYALALIVYIIPIVGNYPAMITLMRDLGIYNTLWGSLIQKFNFFGMYFFVFYAYFENYADSYLEAAEIDGASQMRQLTHIVLPMASKLISTVFLISFVGFWNDYQAPLLYMPNCPTLAYGIYCLSTLSSGALGVTVTSTMKFAGVICTALPIVILFILLKDKLMTNISMGGVKE